VWGGEPHDADDASPQLFSSGSGLEEASVKRRPLTRGSLKDQCLRDDDHDADEERESGGEGEGQEGQRGRTRSGADVPNSSRPLSRK
jgi:hypothetical protein